MSRWFKKYLFRICAFVLALVFFAVVLRIYNVHQQQTDLQLMIAETDRQDPGWRLGDLDAALQDIPADQNAGLIVIEVAKMVPAKWLSETEPSQQELADELRSWPPEKQFDERITLQLESAIAKFPAAMQIAERLAEIPQGRFPLHWSDDNQDGSGGVHLPHVGDPIPVTKLLAFNSLLKAQQGDLEGALDSCCAAVNASRSFGELLSISSFRVRDSCRAEAFHSLERVLAQGEPSDVALERIQKLLELEQSLPLLLNTIRLQRALGDRFLEGARTHKAGHPIMQRQVNAQTQTDMLRALNRRHEIAKSPFNVQTHRMQEEHMRERQSRRPSPLDQIRPWTDGSEFAWVYVGLHMNSFENFHKRYLAYQVSLHCALAAVATERYRQAEGHWPENMEALVPRFLKQVPADPLREGTVSMRAVEDGLIMGATGVHGTYRPSNLSVSPEPETLSGFRLWNVESRRQPNNGI